ncbi:MAG: hypothetical protein KDA33_03945 [Phycisphaerales bacterium]|nr:hypothetical protein [Phycisphaerales bacterium]
MNLRTLQAEFARLVTNDAARRSAQRADGAEGSSDTPIDTLARLPGVDLHAQTLKRKRLVAARAKLPVTAAVLDGALAPLFMRFAGETALASDRRYERDAMAFLDWLEGEITSNAEAVAGLDVLALRSAVRFERAVLRVVLRRRVLKIALVDARRWPGLPPGARRRRVAIWLRVSPNGRLRRWIL